MSDFNQFILKKNQSCLGIVVSINERKDEAVLLHLKDSNYCYRLRIVSPRPIPKIGKLYKATKKSKITELEELQLPEHVEIGLDGNVLFVKAIAVSPQFGMSLEQGHWLLETPIFSPFLGLLGAQSESLKRAALEKLRPYFFTAKFDGGKMVVESIDEESEYWVKKCGLQHPWSDLTKNEPLEGMSASKCFLGLCVACRGDLDLLYTQPLGIIKCHKLNGAMLGEWYSFWERCDQIWPPGYLDRVPRNLKLQNEPSYTVVSEKSVRVLATWQIRYGDLFSLVVKKSEGTIFTDPHLGKIQVKKELMAQMLSIIKPHFENLPESERKWPIFVIFMTECRILLNSAENDELKNEPFFEALMVDGVKNHKGERIW